MVEVVLIQYNLEDHQYQQKSEVLYTFTSKKSYAYLLNVEPNKLVFLKTCNTEFDDIFIIFTDQNGRPIRNRYGYRNGYRFFSIKRNLTSKYGKTLMDTVTKTELDTAKVTSKKIIY